MFQFFNEALNDDFQIYEELSDCVPDEVVILFMKATCFSTFLKLLSSCVFHNICIIENDIK